MRLRTFVYKMLSNVRKRLLSFGSETFYIIHHLGNARKCFLNS